MGGMRASASIAAARFPSRPGFADAQPIDADAGWRGVSRRRGVPARRQLATCPSSRTDGCGKAGPSKRLFCRAPRLTRGICPPDPAGSRLPPGRRLSLFRFHFLRRAVGGPAAARRSSKESPCRANSRGFALPDRASEKLFSYEAYPDQGERKPLHGDSRRFFANGAPSRFGPVQNRSNLQKIRSLQRICSPEAASWLGGFGLGRRLCSPFPSFRRFSGAFGRSRV